MCNNNKVYENGSMIITIPKFIYIMNKKGNGDCSGSIKNKKGNIEKLGSTLSLVLSAEESCVALVKKRSQIHIKKPYYFGSYVLQ